MIRHLLHRLAHALGRNDSQLVVFRGTRGLMSGLRCCRCHAVDQVRPLAAEDALRIVRETDLGDVRPIRCDWPRLASVDE